MSMTPEQFDIYIKQKNAELTEAWKAIPPTENEIIAKAIIDYQYKATMALMNAIQEMNLINAKRDNIVMNKLNEIERKLKGEE